MIKEKHISIYGKVKLMRVYCEKCKGMTILLSNIKQCCDEAHSRGLVKTPEKMITGVNQRKQPSYKRQKEILKIQNNKCLYCEKEFGTPYERNGKVKFTRIHWDHLVPYSYSQTSGNKDFVASCNICNQLKYNLVFETVEEVFRYVEYNRKKKGFRFHEDISNVSTM